MKKIIFSFLSIAFLLSNNAYANEKADQVRLNTGIQEVQAATLDDNDQDHPKKKSTAKKTKKSKKAKKG